MLERDVLGFISERRLRPMAYTQAGKERELEKLSDQCELDMDDRRELDDAVLEMLGVQSAEQRQILIDELYDYLREFFEVTRQKEEKAIINKNKARRLVLVRPGEVAAEILAEIKADHPELLSRYAPDFLNLSRSLDTYDLPAEGQPQELRDLYHDRGMVFMKGKKSIAAIDTHMPEQDPLIILLAESGIRGLVPIPHEKDECQRVLQEYGDFIRRREDAIWALIANRTHDEDMQEKIYAALMLLMTREDNPG